MSDEESPNRMRSDPNQYSKESTARAPEDIGASIGGIGQDVVDRIVHW